MGHCLINPVSILFQLQNQMTLFSLFMCGHWTSIFPCFTNLMDLTFFNKVQSKPLMIKLQGPSDLRGRWTSLGIISINLLLRIMEGSAIKEPVAQLQVVVHLTWFRGIYIFALCSMIPSLAKWTTQLYEAYQLAFLCKITKHLHQQINGSSSNPFCTLKKQDPPFFGN